MVARPTEEIKKRKRRSKIPGAGIGRERRKWIREKELSEKGGKSE